MDNKKRISLSILILALVEVVYFCLIVGITSILGINISFAIVQVVGVLVAIGCTLIVNPFLKEYKRNMDYRMRKIEQEQSRMKRRLRRVEKQLNEEQKVLHEL